MSSLRYPLSKDQMERLRRRWEMWGLDWEAEDRAVWVGRPFAIVEMVVRRASAEERLAAIDAQLRDIREAGF